MSTNDTVLLLASGASGVEPDAGRADRRGHRGLPRPGRAAAGRRRGRHQGDRHRGACSAADRGRRGRGGPRGRPQQPGEDRASSAATRTGAGSWPRSAPPPPRSTPDAIDVAINGVWICRAGAAGDDRAEVDLTGRAVHVVIDLHAGDRDRDHLDQRPVARLRARELGVLDMSTVSRRRARATSAHRSWARPSTLIEALPWLAPLRRGDRGGQVRRQRDDRRRRCSRRSPPTWCSCATSGCGRSWCTAAARRSAPCSSRLGIASEFKGGLRVTTPETMDVVRMVLVGQVGRELVGLINAHGPLAVGMSGEDAGLFTAARRPAHGRRRSHSTSAWSATSSRSTSGAVIDLIEAGRIPVISTVAPDADGVRAQRQRRHRRRRAGRSRCGAASWSCSPTSRASTPTGRTRHRCCPRSTADALEELLPSLESGMVPKMEACLRAVRGGVAAAHVIDGRVRTRCCWRSSPTEGFGTMVVDDLESA